MPKIDGITATQVIRKLQPEKGPKIVAITAYALDGDREKCLEAGMDNYISTKWADEQNLVVNCHSRSVTH